MTGWRISIKKCCFLIVFIIFVGLLQQKLAYLNNADIDFGTYITPDSEKRVLPIQEDIDHPLFDVIKQNVQDKNLNRDNLLSTLTQEKKCPACFGAELCEEISSSYIQLTSLEPSITFNDLMIFPGILAKIQKVSILVPQASILGSFDQLVCPNSKHIQWTDKCQSLIDAENPFLLTPKQFLSEKTVTHNREKLFLQPFYLPAFKCYTPRLKQAITKTYDLNDDGRLQMEEKSILHTTLVLLPHLSNLKLISMIGAIGNHPKVLGSCGRVTVVKGEMHPLSLLINESFQRRASVASQILNLVEEFLENDEMWLMFQPFWDMENLHINENGEVFLSSLTDMYFIEKQSKEMSNACDWTCVHELRKRIIEDKAPCFTEDEAMHVMYSEVCVNIFSNMTHHKFNDYFDQSSSSRIHHRTWPGLLHGIPPKPKDLLEKALTKCIDERKAGMRLSAVDELQDILDEIVNEKNDEYKDGEEEEYDVEPKEDTSH